MIKRIINRYFRDYRYGGFVISLSSCSIYLNSPTLWVDIWRSLISEITFKYNYYFKFKTATVSLREIKGKWDHVPCEKLYTHINKPDEGDNWNALRESLLTSKTHGCLYIRKLSPNNEAYSDFKLKGYTYRVINGNHRIAILKCLYGLDYKIKIKYIVEIPKPKKDKIILQINNGKTDFELQPIKVKLREVEMDYPNATLKNLKDATYCYNNNVELYPWERLMKDIKSKGMLNPPILCTPHSVPIHTPFLYTIYNGNHRIKVLQLLYGNDYEVDVHLLITMKDNLEYVESIQKLKHETLKKDLTSRFKNLEKKRYK